MRLRDKIDAWYESHQGLTALIVVAVVAVILACLPEGARHTMLASAVGAFLVGLVRALKRR